MKVDTVKSIIQWHWRTPTSSRSNESLKTRKRSQTSQTADHVVVNYSDEEPEHLPRTNDHEVAHAEYPKVVLEEAAPEERRTEKEPPSKSQW